MPLDTGIFSDGPRSGMAPQARRPRVTLHPDLEIGAALRAARQALGLSLEQISEETRVRARHLGAIEDARLDLLPSRPFTIGYVRAYAKALGLDADATAARYRTEYPSPDDELRTPVGVRNDRRPFRGGLLMALAGAAVLAVVGWNVALHAMALAPKKAPAVAAHQAAAIARSNATTDGPFDVGAPLPAPAEATAPAPYSTPVAGPDGTATNAVAHKPDPDAAPQPFVPQGTIYGAAAGASNLIIQARKSISLEIRGPDGVVYFARQLAAGEAYRVPAVPGLTAEVSNPDSAELYEGGVSKGVFTAAQMPLRTTG
jgi:transcriptional regulator with XRE-family HTH domain